MGTGDIRQKTLMMSERVHDVVIIGAGVAGALVAYRLAASGLDVALIEAGPATDTESRMNRVEKFITASSKIPNSPYADPIADKHAPVPLVTDAPEEGHYLQTTPETPFKSTYQRLSGGSTWHWLGNTPRFLRSDFNLRSEFGISEDWPINYDDLERWYGEAEVELGVAGDGAEWNDLHGTERSTDFPMPPIWPAYGDHIVKNSINGQIVDGSEIRMRITPQARNSIPYQGRPPCAGNSSCVPICPIAAKYDATVHVKLAQEKGSTFIPRCVAQKLEADSEGRVQSVQCRRWHKDGTYSSLTVKGHRVVLAAHAVESPLLLMISGLASKSPVGGYLMDHLQGYGLAVMPQPVYPFRGPPVTSGIDVFRDGPFRNERAAYRISIGNDGWGREETPATSIKNLMDAGYRGRELRLKASDRLTRLLRMSYSTEMLPEAKNRVTLDGVDSLSNPRPAMSFSLPEYNIRGFEHAKMVMGEMFKRMKVEEMRFSYPRKAYSGAGHIMGTCRMGHNPEKSVTDSDCRVHNHPNLFIAGASLFTTGGTANPTLTVAALALRLANYLSNQSKAEAV